MTTNDPPKPQPSVAPEPRPKRRDPEIAKARLAFARDLGELLAEIHLRGG